ncbi:hypothetical protein [Delftia acidovorans]|uniref:hypothetical protein n=1 Tax=Delftia acidovorans TaxID=80866 RepID=UPI0035A1528B
MSSSPQILHTARVVCGRSDDGAKAYIAHFAVASHHCGIVYIHHRRIHTANMLIFLSPSSEVALVRFYLYSQSSFPSISTTRSFAPSSSGATYYMSQKKACAALEEEKFSNEMPFACTAGTQSPHTTIASVVASLGYRIFMVFPLCTV